MLTSAARPLSHHEIRRCVAMTRRLWRLDEPEGSTTAIDAWQFDATTRPQAAHHLRIPPESLRDNRRELYQFATSTTDGRREDSYALELNPLGRFP